MNSGVSKGKGQKNTIVTHHCTVDLMRYVCSRLFMSISFSPKPKLKQRSCSQNNPSKSAPLLMKALSSVSFVLSCCSSLGYISKGTLRSYDADDNKNVKKQ